MIFNKKLLARYKRMKLVNYILILSYVYDR